jgi:hypothetical protein
MTAFTEFWDIASFRSAFISLIKSPEPTIQALRAALDEGSLPSSPPEGSGVSADVWLGSRSTVRTLLYIRDGDGYTALLSDVSQMVEAPDKERAMEVIQQLLELDSETEQLNLVRNTQRAGLPVLENLSAEVDFRVVPSLSEGEPTLAPVYVVRLTFDEDVAGSNAIVFQVAEDAISIVLQRLEEAKELRASIARRLSRDLLHDQIRREILDNG